MKLVDYFVLTTCERLNLLSNIVVH